MMVSLNNAFEFSSRNNLKHFTVFHLELQNRRNPFQ